MAELLCVELLAAGELLLETVLLLPEVVLDAVLLLGRLTNGSPVILLVPPLLLVVIP